MVLFNIPDIRLFWSEDPRFTSQFRPGEITSFKPYSRYPPCYKDMSFWLPETSSAVTPSGLGAAAAGGRLPAGEATQDISQGRPFHENDFCEIVREVAGDLIEDVKLVSDLERPS